jgi:RHS repeat-associated protein
VRSRGWQSFFFLTFLLATFCGQAFAQSSLPSGWTDGDIGSVGVAGNAAYASNVFTVQGAGSTLNVSADGFHFVYQPLSGDGTIVARVVGTSYAYAQAGVMIRETLDAGSNHMFTAVDAGTIYDIYRTTTGSSSSYGTGGAGTLPYWVELMRSGNTFTGYSSADGVNWVQVASQTITMAQNVYIGLAVAGGSASTSSSATFDNVSVNSGAVPAPAIASVSATTGSVGSQVVISGSGFGASQGSSVVLLNGTSTTVNSWSDSSVTITIPTLATSGYLLVSAAPSMNDSNSLKFTVTAQPLPDPWLDQDVGTVGAPGSAAYASNVFTVQGAGNTLNVSADGFHFVYQPLSGDGTIVARVVGTSYAYAQVGVMIRETLDAGSNHMFMADYAGTIYDFYRTTTGSSSTYGTGGAGTLPYWVELVRNGSTFTGYSSADGVNWVQVASQTITMAQNVYIGLAVASGSSATAYGGTFDNVSVSSVAAPAPAIASVSATTGSVGSQVVISGSGFGASQGSSVVFLNDTPATINSWSGASITITIPTGATSGPIAVSIAPNLNDSNPVVFTVTSNPLPTGWLDRDVGQVGVAGTASYSAGVFTVQGAGNTLNVSADGFHFVYQPLSGDGTIVARVVSTGYAYAQAGAMIRETLNAGSNHFFMADYAGTIYDFYRATTGSASSYGGGGAGTLPYWVKLVRSGSTFTGYSSADGVNWVQVASQTITMAQNVYIGLAVASGSFSAAYSATFDNVSVTVSGGGSFPTITSLSSISGGVGASITITGTNFGANQGSSTVTFNGTAATATSWSTTGIVAPVPSEATSGSVVVVVSSLASNGVSFTVILAPSIATGSPLGGPAGTSVTLSGTNFGATQGTSTVTFNGTTATPTYWSATSIVVPVPSGATTGNIVVTVASLASNAFNFIVAPPPSISSMSRASGPSGTSVALEGVNFGATQGASTVSLSGVAVPVNSWSDTGIVVSVPNGVPSGPFIVTANAQTASSAVFTVTPLPSKSPLPSGWIELDVAPPVVYAAYSAAPGDSPTGGSYVVNSSGQPTWTSATYVNGTFSVSGSGEVSGTADVGHFVYQALSGDGTIIARVTNVQGNGAQAGVMIRDTVDADATQGTAYVQSSYFYLFDRLSTGSSGSNASQVYDPASPYWVQLNRSGNSFSSFTSTDGINWVPVGTSQTITMAQSVYMGLFVSNGNGSTIATATFDNVSVNSTASPAPVITSLSATTGPIGSQVVIFGSGFGSVQNASVVYLNGFPVTVYSWSATAIIVTIPSGATSGPMVVSIAPSMNDSNPIVFNVTTQPLPISWLDQDAGSVPAAGNATYLNGTYTVNGAGQGISSTADSMHFAYQPLSGDGTIVARVVSVSSGTEAGIAIRETLNAKSTEGASVYQVQYLYFYDRASTGANVTIEGDMSESTLPYWLELVRSGNTVSCYTSADGVNWVQMGASQTITMASNVYVGLVVASGGSSTLGTATFENVSVSSTVSPAPIITSLSATTGPVGSQIIVSGSGFGTLQGNSLVLLNDTPVTVNSWSATSIIVTIPSGATSGPMVVSVAPSMNDSNPMDFQVTTQPLPISWLDQDAGSVPAAGNATYLNGTYTVNGAGQGISSTADSMHFAYQPLSGDGTIVARVVSVSSGTEAGIAIRETLNAKSTEGASVYQVQYLYFYDRASTGANVTIEGDMSESTLPYWLELVRSGNTVSCYTSADGVNWVQMGASQTITMASNVYVGLVVASGGSSTLGTATFDNVSVSSTVSPAPIITSLSATTGPVGSQIIVSGSGFGTLQGNSLVLLNDTPVTVNSWSATSIIVTIPSGATSGPMVVSVAPSMNDSNPIVFNVTTLPLPISWLDQDIGSVPTAGSSTYSNATFTVNGTGLGISSAADGMHFAYQPLSGDGTIVARVVSVSSGTEAGIAIRETLNAKSIEGASVYQVQYLYFYDRASTGANVTIEGDMSESTLPYWLELVRSGSTVSCYTSADGVNWVQMGASQTITMASNVYVGLVVASGGSSTLGTAAFDNVSVGSTSSSTPVITGLSATAKPPGGQVAIFGSGFGAVQGSSSVTLNGAAVTVNSWSATSIIITIPAGASSGGIVVTVGGTASNSAAFTVTIAPSIAELSTTSGAIGATVQISGSNFGAQALGTVTFNGINATINSWSTSGVTAVVPQNATSGNVVVTASGIASNGVAFTVVTAPIITSLTPPAAEVYGIVVANGSNFDASGAGPRVYINGAAAYVVSFTDTSIEFQVYPNATSGPVTVSVNGVTSNGVQFTVTEPLSITSVSPPSGAVGSTVTIKGTGFGGTQSDSVLAFDGVAVTPSSWSDLSITAVVTSGTSTGPVSVAVADQTVTGPSFELITGAQLTDSLGHTSNYSAGVTGGSWYVTSAQGSGCSTCTIRGVNQYQYDALGNVLSATDALGRITSYTYDSSSDALSVTLPAVSAGTPTTSYTYNSFGEVLTATDPLGKVTTNAYDSHGNLLSVTAPVPSSGGAASVTQFAYNSLGELTQITDPLGHNTAISYTSAGVISSITDAQGNVTSYTYDPRGNRSSVTDALSHVTNFAFDAGNRLLTITYPGGSTSTFTYDYRGRRITATDQNGKTTTYSYDAADRLITVTDAASNVTQYSYDTESNLLSITDANSHTTDFSYDAFARVTQTTFPSNYVETYAYDAVNNLTSKTDRKGQTIQYLYDALNRLTQKSYPDSTSVEYVYDLVGKIQQVADPTGTYGYSYDNMGRLIGTTTQYSFLTSQTFSNSYTYDAASNRTGFTAPDTSTNTYGYDSLNRLTNLANSWAGLFGFSYDALSRRTQMTRPNGVSSSYSYDNLSHLLSVLHQVGGSTIDGASYTVDPVGNRTAKTDQRAAVTSNYGYDAIYQLLSSAQGGSTVESYTYDPVGNRLSSLGASAYTNNSSNELTATSNASYAYDYNGNTTSKTDGNGTTGYSWDSENRLTQVTLPGTNGTVVFKYDPFGRRIYKQSPNATSIFLYDGESLVETVNASGSEVAHYTQGQNIDEPLAMQRGSAVDYYEADGIGSVTSLTATNGSIAESYTYDSFGNTTNSSGALTNFFRYTAREFDAETNLYFYRARYFDPVIGKFISEDPTRFEAGVDFYSYSFNDPIGMVDPSGLRCNKPSFAALWNNYPSPDTYPTAVQPSGRTSIWDLIGGHVGKNGNSGIFKNSCTVRLSYALNKGGCSIPYIKGKTVSGADGDWYFFRLSDLSAYLEEQWGPAEVISADDWKASLAGQTGIIQYEIQWSDATGHASLWDGNTNVDGPAHDYSDPAARNNAPFNGILFWPLK